MKIIHKYTVAVSLTILSILILAFVLTPRAWAVKPQEVLDKFEARLKGLKSYCVETIEKSKSIGPQGMEESRGQGKTFVKGTKRYTEITIIRNKELGKELSVPKSQDQQSEEKRIVQVFDGTVSWFYETDKKEIKRVDFSKLPAEMQEKIKESQDTARLKLPKGLEFDLEEKKEGKKKFYVLTSNNTVTVGGQKYEKIILWMDAKEYLPAKVEMHGKIIIKIPQASNLEIQTQTIQEFKNWELDPDIPDSKFVFTVPEGVKVIDATKETEILYEKYLKNM